MSPTTKTRIKNWIVGAVIGTLLIAVTSPLFVRSYLPEQFDPTRNTTIPAPNSDYRWRSEGYVTTRIGPHGMPGRKKLPVESQRRVALWGDSQAEGVCVADEEKLFAQIESKNVAVLPLARSGDDLSDWIEQIPAVEKNLDVEAHVLLIVDLSDLHFLYASSDDQRDYANDHDVNDSSDRDSQSLIASYVPAFAIQAMRNLMTDNSGNARQLRFGVGPRSGGFCVLPPVDEKDVQRDPTDWEAALSALRRATSLPIVIVYAPKNASIPTAADKRLKSQTWEQKEVIRLASATNDYGIIFHSANDALATSIQKGHLPQGFHNGQIGSGHFNAVGYKTIAAELKPIIANLLGPQE